jgi:hypothetical protein
MIVNQSVTLSPADQEAVLNAIADIRQKLPFLTDLTAAERQSIARLGNKSHSFVRKALDLASQNPGVLPASITVDGMRNAVQLFEGLTAVKIAVNQLQKQVADTAIRAGGEAFSAARAVYACAKSGFAGPGVKSLAEDLGKRFVRKSHAAANGEANDPATAYPPPPLTGST